MIGIVGLAAFYGLAYLLSSNRRTVSWRLVAWGFSLQILFALLILKWSLGRQLLQQIAAAVSKLLEFADKGSDFVFGPLANPDSSFGLIFAFKVLPIVIFISSLFSVLYYLGIMQRVVLLMARMMHRLMGVSGSESLAAAANVFMGQTEAPIIIAPYIPDMTESELMALMTGGMATVSGAVLASYIGLGVRAEYLLSASVMAAPASLVMAKLLIPETGQSKTAGRVSLKVEATNINLIDAAASGAAKGIKLALNIGGMLVAFVALIYLIDGILGAVGNAFASLRGFLTLQAIGVGAIATYLLFWQSSQRTRKGVLAASIAALLLFWTVFLARGPAPISLGLRQILGITFAPVAFIMGVPWRESATVGELFGIKLMLNEFVAYVELGKLLQHGALSAKGELIASYALCGFANFSSIGIQIGGIGPLAPSRRGDLARLGLRALLGGMMASFTVATLAGMLTEL
ncbi:MAG: NupC/NupG family nucleoside CNT transporter [Acidobacteriota bacterium]